MSNNGFLDIPDSLPAKEEPIHQPVDVPGQARAFLESLPGSIAGEGGNAEGGTKTFSDLMSLLSRFVLTDDEVLTLISEAYNPRCQPPWNESELRHKISDVRKALLAAPGRLGCDDLPRVSGGRFRRGKDGLFFHPEDEDASPLFLCGPHEVLAMTRDQRSDEWGVWLKWQDSDGHEHFHLIGHRQLAGDGLQVRAALMAGGLPVTPYPKGRQLLLTYLNNVRVNARARVVSKIGWSNGAFILPNLTLGGSGEELTIFQGAHNSHAFNVAGTLESWRDSVGRLCVGNSRLILGVAAALAATQLTPLKIEPGGIHFKGGSSTGKSTTLFVAGSVCGGGDSRKGFLRSWRATSNGLETIAVCHNDCPLLLDEIGEIDGTEVGKVAYMLANGQQKSRAKSDGSSRPVNTWTLLLLSTGEQSLTDKMAEAGLASKVGQEVRLITIPADAGAGYGMFENLHGAPDGASFADRLREAALAHYGAPFRAFIQAIVDSPDGHIPFLRQEMGSFVARNTPSNADGQVQRVAQRFALISAAGELGIHLGILPWQPGDAQWGVGVCFHAWLTDRGDLGPAEVTKGVQQVLRFLQAHGNSRFEDAWAVNPIQPHNRAGFRRLVGDQIHYYIFPEAFRAEVCKGFDSKIIAKALVEQGIMIGEGGKSSRSIRIPNHKTQRFYCFPNLPADHADGPPEEP